MSSTISKLGGISAVASGILLVAGELMYFVVGVGEAMEGSAATLASPASVFQSMIFLVAGVFLVGAVVFLYASHAESLGRLGLAGFLVAFVGTVLAAGTFWDGAFITPALAADAPELLESAPPALVEIGFTVSFALLSLGWLALGLALFRNRALSRPAAALIMAGAVIAFAPLPFTYIPFGLALAWTSLSIRSESASRTEAPFRVG